MLSTGITDSVIDKATANKIPVISIRLRTHRRVRWPGISRDFPPVTNYWSQNTAKIKFIGMKEGGMNKLKGKRS